jgi:hypothetical protein
MLRRVVASVAFAAWLAGCGSSGHAAAPAPARALATAGHGIAVRLPRGWHLVRSPVTSLSYPHDRLLLTSYPARAGGNCAPDRAEAALPPGGALVFAYEYRGGRFAPRPAQWDFGPALTYECWRVPSHMLRFRAAGRSFQVQVAFGPRATTARRAQVQRILRSLRISRRGGPPPALYAGWRSLGDVEGDTLRTPPGWPSLVTRDPRSEPQPRTLFATANVGAALPGHATFPPGGVQLRVIEERPGPASGAFPQFPTRAWPVASDFRTTQHGLRAAGEQHRSRFSIWIVRGPAAAPADVAAARHAAASVGLSIGAFRNRARRVTVTQLQVALRTNPHNEASHVACRRVRRPPSRSPLSPPPTFTCRIAFGRQRPATYDVQTISGRCFVAERRRPGRADYGCIRP